MYYFYANIQIRKRSLKIPHALEQSFRHSKMSVSIKEYEHKVASCHLKSMKEGILRKQKGEILGNFTTTVYCTNRKNNLLFTHINSYRHILEFCYLVKS